MTLPLFPALSKIYFEYKKPVITDEFFFIFSVIATIYNF